MAAPQEPEGRVIDFGGYEGEVDMQKLGDDVTQIRRIPERISSHDLSLIASTCPSPTSI